MISHEYKFIFIHIPKCGGNSIKSSLNIEGHDHTVISHKKYSKYMQYFKFAITRNPWDRFVSAYTYLQTGGMQGLHDLRRKKKIDSYNSFKEFVLKAPFTTSSTGADGKNIYLHFRPMFRSVEIGGKTQMDFVGRVETLQEDFNIVCDKIGFPRQILPHVNKTKHKHYIEYYDDETREIIAERYAKDIEYFGYKFGE